MVHQRVQPQAQNKEEHILTLKSNNVPASNIVQKYLLSFSLISFITKRVENNPLTKSI